VTIFDVAESSSRVFELAGVATMVGGLILAVVLALARDRRAGAKTLFARFRNRLGRTILLGLEFLVAADILRTILEVPTMQDIVVLGGIVLVRTFLSFTLEVELEGRWPWQPKKEEVS
jgi:uncharacterized membrane protein